MPAEERLECRSWPAILPALARLGAVISVLFAATAAAHAETTLERAREQGYIRIGFANEEPFAYATADGKLTGESPEVLRVILRKIGIPEIEGVLTEFGSLIPGLKAGRFDIVAAGMYITPQRCREVAFSEPTYGIGEAILVKEGNPKSIRDFGSFLENEDLTLAVMAGATGVGYARAAGIPQSQLTILSDQASMLAAVQSGRADGAALSALSIANMAKRATGVESTEPFYEFGGKSVTGHGAFALRKEDGDLLELINKELKAFIGTPEHLALVTPFGFGKGYLPRQSTAELCAAE
jgi:polar amino acid transport system substrate-binding protein